MNFRNRNLVIVLRTVFGLLFTFSGVAGLLTGPSLQGVPAPLVPTMQVLLNTGLFHMIKITETVSGLMLLTGFLPWLAAIFLAPICIGIIVFNARMSPELAPIGVVLSLFDAYFGYAYWDKYKALFKK